MDVISIGALLMDFIAEVEDFSSIEEEAFVLNFEVEHGGSAANTAVACANLGLRSGFIGKIGEDELGAELANGLKKVGVDISHVKIVKGYKSGICMIIRDKSGKRQMYSFSGAANLLSDEEVDEDYIISSKFLHIADLRNIAPLQRAALIASKAGVKVSFNPGGLISGLGYNKVEGLLSLADVLVLSENDAMKLYATDDMQRIFRSAFKSGLELVAVTLGKKGCIIADKKKKYSIPSFHVKAVDFTGAGDAFSAGMIYSLVNNFSTFEAGLYASAAAALCTTTYGARFMFKIEDVERLVEAFPKQ